MPKIQQHTVIDVTPEKFLNACDSTELFELEILLSSRRYQEKMGKTVHDSPVLLKGGGKEEEDLPIAGPIPRDILDYYDALNAHDDKTQTCHQCGCTDLDCSQCIAATGVPCHWVAPNLCSACAENSPLSKT